MGSDMIGLVAFDFVLRVVLGSVVCIALIVKIPGVDFDDFSGNMAGFGVPGDVVAYYEFLIHGLRICKKIGVVGCLFFL